MEALRERFIHKTQKKLSIQSIKCQLKKMGLLED